MDGGRGRQGDLTEGRGGKKERRERIHQWYGGEGAEGGNRESKGEGTAGGSMERKETSLRSRLQIAAFTRTVAG